MNTFLVLFLGEAFLQRSSLVKIASERCTKSFIVSFLKKIFRPFFNPCQSLRRMTSIKACSFVKNRHLFFKCLGDSVGSFIVIVSNQSYSNVISRAQRLKNFNYTVKSNNIDYHLDYLTCSIVKQI